VSRWRVSIRVVAAGETFRRSATTEAANLEDLMDGDLPALEGWVEELEAKVDVADVTRLALTVERVR